jgi:hypothetical protein
MEVTIHFTGKEFPHVNKKEYKQTGSELLIRPLKINTFKR